MGTTAIPGTDASAAKPDASGGQGGEAGRQPAGSGSAAGAGGEGIGAGLDRSKLNPLIRGMSEDQLNEVFDQMITTINSGRQPEPAAAPAPGSGTPAKVNYRELMDPNSEKFDPEAAFNAFIASNYGPLVTSISGNAMVGLFNDLRNEFSDFKEYEADVRTLASKQPPGTVTRESLMGTYYTVKGFRLSNKEKADRAKAGTTVPKTIPEDQKVETQLSPEEEEAAMNLFKHASDPRAEYRKYLDKLNRGDTSVPVKDGSKPAGGKGNA